MGLLLSIGACQTSQPPLRQYALLHALEHNLANAKRASDQALKELKRDVKKNGNSREGLERIKRAEQLKLRTAQMLGELDKIKQFLLSKAGDGLDPKTQMPKRPLNKGTTRQIMKKETTALSKRLNAYTLFITVEFKDLMDQLKKGLIKISTKEICTFFKYYP